MRLENKVAIVTGAGRGIGAALARAFAREGAAVIVNYFRSDESAEDVVDEIGDAGGRAAAVQADVSDPSEHGRLIAAALDYFDGLDILVNNAGIRVQQPFLDADPEAWDRIFDVNLKGAYFLAQRAARVMAENGRGGRILNVSSANDTRPPLNNSIYSITKAGLKMMTKCLALELAIHRICVNSLSPGVIETDSNREALADEASRQEFIGQIPLRQIGSVDDLTAAAVLLCSEEGRYITGTTLYVDGGLLL